MKHLIPILLFFGVNGFAQQTFTSPYTQNVHTGEIENIPRTIIVDTSEIRLLTNSSDGVKIQSWKVVSIDSANTNQGNFVNYHCDPKTIGEEIILSIPLETEIIELLLFQKSPNNPRRTIYRFMVD